MKKGIALASMLAAMLALLLLQARASFRPLVQPFGTVNNTVCNSTPSSVTVSAFPSPSLYIQNNGLTTVSDLVVNVQFSLDSNTWRTVATYHPTIIAATNEAWNPASGAQTVWWRTQTIATNGNSFGVVVTADF